MCVEDAGRALHLTGHFVDRHGRGGGGDDRLGAREHRCPSRHIALKSSTSDTASKITATEAKAGPASERGTTAIRLAIVPAWVSANRPTPARLATGVASCAIATRRGRD